jgi:hypothetical protein
MTCGHPLLRLFFVTIASALACLTALAQDEPAWRVPGKWRPWSMGNQSADLAKCASRAEWSTFEGKLKKLRGVWEQMAEIAAPVGYEIMANGGYPVETCLEVVYAKAHKPGERPYVHEYDKKLPLRGDVSFYPFNHVALSPKLEVNHETLPVYFNVNRIPSSNLPLLRHEFIEPLRMGERFGLPAYAFLNARCTFEGEGACGRRDNFLVLRNNPAPLWVPAPLLDVYDELLEEAQFQIPGFEREAEKIRKSLDEFVTPKSRADREASCRSLAAMQKKKSPEDYLAQCLEGSRRFEAQKRQDVAEAGPFPGTRWGAWVAGQARLMELRQSLLVGNPKAVAYLCAMPAYESGSNNHHLDEYATQFKTEGGPRCRAVVKVNKAYYDGKQARTAMQLITVTDYEPCLHAASFAAPGQCKADLKLLNNIRWGSVLELMDK